MRAVMVAIVAGVLSACGSPSGSEAPELDQEALQTRTFDLRVGEAVTVGELRIAFQAVPVDSRCPRNVVCAWMGDAAVRLGLRESAGDEVIRELHTHPDLARTAEVGGVAVRLAELSPYPVEPGIIGQDAYVARLTVAGR